MKSVEEIMREPYWIIDILPECVPRDSAGQYFAVEKYYLQGQRLAEVKQRHINVILKLNCYRDISVDGAETVNPPPEQTAEAVRSRSVSIRTGDTLILSEPDDLYLTVFHPDEPLLSLLNGLASGEGLFVWKP